MTDCPSPLPDQYRRRCGLSRPCSGWERVGRPRCNDQDASTSIQTPTLPAQTSESAPSQKLLAMSSAWLHRLHGVHLPPLEPVVFRWPSSCDWRSPLGVSFALRCFQRFSRPNVSYPALPLARQPAHRRFVHPGPLVLGAAPRKPPPPTTDRDRTVSRRSEPSSRTALIGEQPNPWDLLQPQDATSRHRGAKPCRRCELLGKISLLSPG